MFFSFLVKLVGGANQLEGNVFALNPKTGVFGPVCDDGWNIQNVSYYYFYLTTVFNICSLCLF